MKKYNNIIIMLGMTSILLVGMNNDTQLSNKTAKFREFALDTAIGTVTGLSEFATGRPLENKMIQTMQQCSKNTSITKFSLYAGSMAHLVGIVPVTVAQKVLKEEIEKKMPQSPLTASFLAGALSTVVCTPTDVVTLTQVNSNNSLRKCFKNIFSKYGLKGLYKGAFAVGLREGIFAPGYLWVIPKLTTFFNNQLNNTVASLVLAGATGGVGLSLISHPLKTVSVWQQDGRAVSILDAIGQMSKEPGGLLKTMYQGGVSRAWRYALALVFMAQTDEWLTNQFKK